MEQNCVYEPIYCISALDAELLKLAIHHRFGIACHTASRFRESSAMSCYSDTHKQRYPTGCPGYLYWNFPADLLGGSGGKRTDGATTWP